MAAPIVDNGLGLNESIQTALKSGFAENQALMEAKITELLEQQDDCPTFLEAKRLYLGQPREKMHHSSEGVYKFFFRSFEDLIGNKKINDIKSKDVGFYLSELAHLPPNIDKNTRYAGKSYKEVIALAKSSKESGISKGTQKKFVNYLRAFFNWCYEALDLKRNPCAGLSLSRIKKSKEQARHAFNADDLTKIFDVKLTAKYKEPQKFWTPLMALYSGMRVNEASQLFVSDIVSVEMGLDAAGHPIKTHCFDVSPRDGKSVKTEYSERIIPIHSKLIELGFLDYVEDVRKRGLKHLFPGIKHHINGPGARVSQWFNNSLLRTKCGIEDHHKTFHGFRNTFWTYGDRSQVLETALIKLAGYSPGDTIQRVHYIKRAEVSECKKALEGIIFPALDLQSYKAVQFKDHLDTAQANAKDDERVEIVVKKRRGRPPKSASCLSV